MEKINTLKIRIMKDLNNSCLSCLKPLKKEQSHCDECDYINIETNSLDDRLLLIYFKYLEKEGLSLHHIRHDKLKGNNNFDFDVSLQFLDDDATTSNLLYLYISKKHPDLIKNNSFMNIGFSAEKKDFDTKNIEKIKKNVFDPIVRKIKEVYISLDQMDKEFSLIKPFVFSPRLFDYNTKTVKLQHTFKLISSAKFRQDYKSHLSTNALEVNAITFSLMRREILKVIYKKAFDPGLRDLASFIYQVEGAIGSRSFYQTMTELASEEDGVRYTKLYENTFYNEKMLQLLSYKTHFPALNYDASKVFRNALSIRTIAETLRALEGKSDELDPWIYLACEEVGLQNTIVFNESTATSISDDFVISLTLALDGEIPSAYKKEIIENEKYISLHWLLKEENIERNYHLFEPKLTVYQFEVIQDLVFNLEMELKNNSKIAFSQETKSNFFKHFISDENPNKRLFRRNERDSKTLQFNIMKLLFQVANHNEFEQLLPMVKEPLINSYYIDVITALIWKRSYVHIDGNLLELIDNLGEGKLSKFIASGPNTEERLKVIDKLIIDDSATLYVMKSLSKKRIDGRAVNRFSSLVGNVKGDDNS